MDQPAGGDPSNHPSHLSTPCLTTTDTFRRAGRCHTSSERRHALERPERSRHTCHATAQHARATPELREAPRAG
jgi:hypothetical protein